MIGQPFEPVGDLVKGISDDVRRNAFIAGTNKGIGGIAYIYKGRTDILDSFQLNNTIRKTAKVRTF